MRRASALTALALFGAIALVVTAASSAAGPRTDSGWVKVHSHAAGFAVVKQVGKRNYAGPNCPGSGWNCTTATRVLQIAADGGENVATCTTPVVVTPSSQRCDITQSGSSNLAWCAQRMTVVPSANQICNIKQTGAKNQAAVLQSIEQKRGAAQAANQTASVTQEPAAGDTVAQNVLGLAQIVVQSTGTGAVAASQAQDGHQSAVVSQTARGTGTNWSDVYQSQGQNAGNGALQAQNAQGLPSGFADCAGGGVEAPNGCANVAQHSIGGNNTSILKQTVTESETSRVVSTQLQGSEEGGLQGKVHQDTDSGTSTNKASQAKQQTMTASSGSTQTQHDPISCCGFASQDGGTGNTESITQTSNQNASEPNAVQTTELSGESVSDGTCSVTQSAQVNGDSTSIAESSEPPCGALVVESSCTDGSECTSTVVPQEEVLGASLPTAAIDSTITQGGAPNYADTYVTPYVAQFGGSVTSWTAQFTGGTFGGGEFVQPGVPAGIQLKVFRPVAAAPGQFEVVAAGTVHDPRPELEQIPGYPMFQTQDGAITFTEPGLDLAPGDIVGVTISADPSVGAYYYPLVGPAGTYQVLRNVGIGDTVDVNDPFTATLEHPPALQVTLGEAAPPPPIG